MTHPNQITNRFKFCEFITGGNATVTIVSKRTGKRYTYKIVAASKIGAATGESNPHIFFVSVLTGPDNGSDFHYVGFFHEGGPGSKVKLRGGKKGCPDDVRFRGFDYVLQRCWNGPAPRACDVPEDVEIFHEWKCCRCGRKLTTPESIKDGIGPECAKKVAAA